MLDVWILTYYSDCETARPAAAVKHNSGSENVDDVTVSMAPEKSILNKFMDKVPAGELY